MYPLNCHSSPNGQTSTWLAGILWRLQGNLLQALRKLERVPWKWARIFRSMATSGIARPPWERATPWREGGQQGKGREHKKGAGEEEVCPPLSGKRGTELVAISNLDAPGLWVREGHVGKDYPRACMCSDQWYTMKCCRASFQGQASRDWHLSLPVAWIT